MNGAWLMHACHISMQQYTVIMIAGRKSFQFHLYAYSDPEKDILLNPLPYRSIQIGISGIAVEQYLNEWIVQIDDITPLCMEVHNFVLNSKIEEVKVKLPEEKTLSFISRASDRV